MFNSKHIIAVLLIALISAEVAEMGHVEALLAEGANSVPNSVPETAESFGTG
jgi:hypothetical protein